MATTLLMSLAFFVALDPGRAQPDPRLVRVFVTTDDGVDSDELRARRESVKHLAGTLAKQKKLLAIVEKEELADLTVEVLERRVEVPRVVVGIGARPGQPPGGVAPARTAKLVVRLESRIDTLTLTNKREVFETSGGWSAAADDVAKQIEQWTTEHRKRIVEMR